MALIDLIFPKRCLECNKEGQYICQNCITKVQILKPVCPYCEKSSIDGFTHIKCKKKLCLDGLCGVWRYGGVIKKAIQALKYKYATEIVQELCGYFVPELAKLSIKNIFTTDFAFIPIPIYWHRENVRGFNQSEEIGKIIANKMVWKFDPNLLMRTKSAKPQAGLTVADRKKNLRGVFSVPIHDSSFIIPNSVILFDDVFTTGSTLHEACKILKRNGVEKVWGLTVAR